MSQRKKLIQNGVIQATVATKEGKQVVDSHLDMVAELRKVNNAINEELVRAKTLIEEPDADIKTYQELIVKLSGEIRRQLSAKLLV